MAELAPTMSPKAADDRAAASLNIETEDQRGIPTATSAATAVLKIPELLESVLAYVDIKTLLLSQRVSRTWHKIIASSPQLQKKLFFKPTTLEEAISLTVVDFAPGPIIWKERKKVPDRDESRHPPTLVNPLLYNSEFTAGDPLKIHFTCLVHGQENGHGASSWQRMYACQPPRELFGTLHLEWDTAGPEIAGQQVVGTPSVALRSRGAKMGQWCRTVERDVAERRDLRVGWETAFLGCLGVQVAAKRYVESVENGKRAE